MIYFLKLSHFYNFMILVTKFEETGYTLVQCTLSNDTSFARRPDALVILTNYDPFEGLIICSTSYLYLSTYMKE